MLSDLCGDDYRMLLPENLQWLPETQATSQPGVLNSTSSLAASMLAYTNSEAKPSYLAPGLCQVKEKAEIGARTCKDRNCFKCGLRSASSSSPSQGTACFSP